MGHPFIIRKCRGVYFFYLWGKIWPNNMLGEKILKGDEKGGKMYIFPLLVKSMHIFSPIDLKQNFKKRLNIFSLGRAAPHNIIIFIWGKNMSQEGEKINFKYTPLRKWKGNNTINSKTIQRRTRKVNTISLSQFSTKIQCKLSLSFRLLRYGLY